MVQWFKPVLLLAALLITSGSASKKDNKYEVNIKHGPFEIHQRHVNAKPFKESSHEVAQNNPQIGYQKEASLAEDVYEPRRKGRNRDERWESKIVAPNPGTGRGRGQKNGSGLSWTYTTTFEPTEPSTTKAPSRPQAFTKFGQRQSAGGKRTSTQQPKKEKKWVSTTPVYQNFVTTQQSNDPNLHKQGFIGGLEKLPLQQNGFRNTQSQSYGKIRTQGNNAEDNFFQRTTNAPKTEDKLIVVNPVTPSVLFRNPQLRVPFSTNGISSAQFLTAPKEGTTTTTAAPTTTATTTHATTTTFTSSNSQQQLEDDKDAIYLLVKYEQPRDGGKAKANVVEIIGGHSRVTTNNGNTRSRKKFEGFDFGPAMEEQLMETLKNVNLNSIEVTTAGNSNRENQVSDELNQVTTSQSLVQPPINNNQSNDKAVKPTQQDLPQQQKKTQTSTNAQPSQQSKNNQAIQPIHQFQFHLQQQKQILAPISPQPIKPAFQRNIPNISTPMTPQGFRSKFVIPDTFWGLGPIQPKPQQQGFIQQNAFRVQHMSSGQSQQKTQQKFGDQSDQRFQLDRSSDGPLDEPSGNSLQQSDESKSDEYGETGLRDSYGDFVRDEFQDFDDASGKRLPDTESIENISSSIEKINETTDPLELTRILVSRNGGLTVEQFNKLFKDYLNKELTESDLDSYEKLVEIAGSNESDGGESGTTDKKKDPQEQLQNDAGNEVSGSSEGDDLEGIKVQINKSGGRHEPIVKIGYGSSKSHQGVYKSPKFLEKLKESSSHEEEHDEQWIAPQGPAPNAYVDNPIFGFAPPRLQEAKQQLEPSSANNEELPKQQDSVSDEPSQSGHQGGLSYIKFEKFN